VLAIKSNAMSEKNVLLKMTMEKARMINELITKFLGHEPTKEEKKEFHIMNRLGESIIYHKGNFVGTVKYEIDDGLIM
jgi:hypothetical protein